jgi:hypothetical protein
VVLQGESPQDADDMLTLDEALEALGRMDKSTFYRKCKAGLLAKTTSAKKVYVKRKWIWDYWALMNSNAEAERNRRAEDNDYKIPRPRRKKAA